MDWQQVFPRQCPKLGIEAFIRNGVRPALIPLLINYFQGRKMRVKWHGVLAFERELEGSGPQGSCGSFWHNPLTMLTVLMLKIGLNLWMTLWR